jgi:N utilization substance protein B
MTNKRSRARQHALQALYQWQVSGQDVADIERQFLEDEMLAKADVGLFVDLLRGIPGNLRSLDQALVPFLDRPMAQVDPVERAVLRIGAFELAYHLDIPYRVVINEAVELAKVFGAEQGHRYVNGVLDKLAQRLRPREAVRKTRKPSVR